MCRLLAAGEPHLNVCESEIDRPAPSYTVDTLRIIHANHPDVEPTLIVGADMALNLPSWRQPREILRLARLAVAPRAEIDRQSVLAGLAGLDGGPDSAFLEMGPVEVSSSLVRARAAAGEPIARLVGPEVAAYIARHRLYRAKPA
jgi:nicotinate-nucleotide adenylyltransferase